MAAFSSVMLAGGLGLGAAGLGMQYVGMQEQKRAQEGAVRSQVAAEGVRQQALKFDAQRRQRESIRQGIVMRGAALNESANTGTQYGSGVMGTMGQISNQTQYNIAGVSGQAKLGEEISGFNIGALRAGQRASAAGTFASMGAGITSLGGSILNNLGSINRLGQTVGIA